MTGYSRDQFGPAWADVNHNGCDTRNDILARDLTTTTIDGDKCTVLSGLLRDPYTGHEIHFHRGITTSTAVQIDHLVALGDAWQTGAAQLTVNQREQLANDPLELQAVDGPTNEAKGDSDAASWLPPTKNYRCTYVARQIRVKTRYQLWVTRAEHDAMQRILARCGTSQGTPAGPKPTAPTEPRQATASGADSADLYRTCAAAQKAGVTPLHRGDPGYRPELDRDGDGIARED